MSARPPFTPFAPASPRARILMTWGSFLFPLVVWCAVSYLPFFWHPMVRITDPGGVTFLEAGQLIEKEALARENARVIVAGGEPAVGRPSNPIFLPAPHRVAVAMVRSFTTPPRRAGEPWLHQSLWHSIRIIFWGFLWSCVFGVPLGLLCGVYAGCSRMTEPVVDFIRYMPAPAFGALAVAVFGIHDAPKIAIIFIGTFFQMVLVIANTTRKMDPALLEAAQTLGAKRRHQLFQVVFPGVAADLYNDLRILLGWAWTYLIVAEYIGASSGITYFIYQQARYRIYDNVFAAILMIGIIGFFTDRIFEDLSLVFFPWKSNGRRSILARPFSRTKRPVEVPA
ncbi:MAG: ABC transporter permease subunit [Verrucomicrobia bacterium]|nr:ABC transporter permease subunit [Verrucomicrobiota bacterium]MCH8513481.1 ABC transporter permease subunit [Kiritimatiellia bacterium]